MARFTSYQALALAVFLYCDTSNAVILLQRVPVDSARQDFLFPSVLWWQWKEKGKMSISWSTGRKTSRRGAVRSQQSDLLKADAPSEFIVCSMRGRRTRRLAFVCSHHVTLSWAVNSGTQVARSFTLQPSSAHLHPDLNRSKASKQMKLALPGSY